MKCASYVLPKSHRSMLDLKQGMQNEAQSKAILVRKVWCKTEISPEVNASRY